MSDRPRNRQELYERIRQTSKDEFILEDMIRLGFWPQRGALPEDPADEVRRIGELQRELDTLRGQNRNLHNEQALLKELRHRRLAESRRKRQETKERHERERQERAAAWRARKAKEITFLGEGVSGGLNHAQPDPERLRRAGLPELATAEQLAAAMGLSVPSLRFLAFSRRTAPVSHYVRFLVPKKTGGKRLISAPMPRLKAAQRWILEHLLGKLAVEDPAHGFRAGRSILTNARPHLGRDVVLNVDLKDFFPTVGYRRVKGLFHKLGLSEQVATILALLCTEPALEEVELDGRRFFVALGDRHLPQGAPTSPAITNLLCRRLDRRLTGLAARLGFTYTRYADDLTFSASGAPLRDVGEVLAGVRSIVAHEGFVVHPEKTRVLRGARRREVTGLVVNGPRPAIPRDVLRRFRATLFQIEKDGPAGKRWGRSADVISSVRGFANYVRMVDPEKGAALQEQVRRIIEKHGWQPPRPVRKQPPAPPPPAAAAPAPAPELEKPPEKPRKKWWKLF